MRGVRWQETSWDTGTLDINPAAVGAFANQAGDKLSAMSHGSGGAARRVLGTAGEGLRDAGMGAGIGASIGSVIPGLGNVLGGAIGAIGGAIVGVVHHLLGGPHRHRRRLTPHERAVLNRGLRIAKTRHLPGAFQDAVLCVYNPRAYQAQRAQHRLPSEIEAQLLKKQAYATHAAAIDRLYGARLRRELAHLPPDLRALVGVGAVTGHARELYVALHLALTERARLARQAARGAHRLHLALPVAERAHLANQGALVLATPLPDTPETPLLPEPTTSPAPVEAPESSEDPFRELPGARDAEEEGNTVTATSDTDGVLDDLSIALEQSRRDQRSYLRDSWVKDTWLGDFLRLDQPDDPSATAAPMPTSGSGRPPTITLVPEPDTGDVVDAVYGRAFAQDAGAPSRMYTARGDETPQTIAKRYDALTRERWATELKAANPERDWTTRIYAGDAIVIPDAWPQPFWGSAKERGFLDTSGPTVAHAVDTADPFVELRAQRVRPS